MQLYEKSFMKNKFVCANKQCNVRLELNTDTGEVVQIATGIAAIGAIAMAIVTFFASGN